MQSDYSNEVIEQLAWARIEKKYGTFFTDTFDRKERTYILWNSPTALSFLLFEEKLHPPQSLLSRKVLLDTALLFGGLVDVYRYPDLLQDRELTLCLRSIGNQIPKQVTPYINLLQALGSLKENTPQELLEKIKHPGKKGGEHEIKLTLKVPNTPISEKYSFLHLWTASGVTSQPLELTPSYIKQLKTCSKGVEKVIPSETERLVGITIIPEKKRVTSYELEIYAKLEIKSQLRTITFILPTERQLGNYDYPYKIGFEIYPSGKEAFSYDMNFKFVPQLFDVMEYYRFNGILEDMKSRKLRRLKIQTEKEERILVEDLTDEFSGLQPFLNVKQKEVYQTLAELQRLTGYRIPTYGFEKEQFSVLQEVYPQIDSMTRQKAINIINKIIKDKVVTSYRLTLYDKQKSWIKDHLCGSHWGLVNFERDKFHFYDEKKSGQFLEALDKRNEDFSLQMFSPNSPLEIWDIYLKSFKEKLVLPTFLSQVSDEKFIPSSSIVILFRKLVDRVLLKEQVVHLQIYPVEPKDTNKKEEP